VLLAEKRDTDIRELLGKIASLEDGYKDLEGTVTQFRELVIQLQTYVIVCFAYIHICILLQRTRYSPCTNPNRPK